MFDVVITGTPEAIASSSGIEKPSYHEVQTTTFEFFISAATSLEGSFSLISTSQPISLLKEALPASKRHLVAYHRLRMSPEYSINHDLAYDSRNPFL